MPAEISVINVQRIDVLLTSIVVLWLGMFLTGRIRFLSDYNIPAPVSGGLVCSCVVAVVFLTLDTKIQFDLSMRDDLLIIFFSTIGLSAKFSRLLRGGRLLSILLVIAIFFLIFQNLAGTLVAWLVDARPAAQTSILC